MLIRTHRDFRRLWAAGSLSAVGTQVTALAVPLTAVVYMHASTFEVGELTAAEALPLLLFGLPFGAWVDRIRRRRMLVAMDTVRALALATLPVAAAVHALSLAQLYAVSFVVGAASIGFSTAHQAYLPSLVERDELAAANGALQTTQSAAYAIGPGIGGALVQVLTAPIALAVDAASYVWSAAWIRAIHTAEQAVPRPDGFGVRRQIAEGIRVIAADPVLRWVTLYNACCVFFLSIERALQAVFLVRTVGLEPAVIGVVTSMAAIGAIGGGLLARRLIARAGEVQVMLIAACVGNGFILLVPLAAHGARLALFVVGLAMTSAGIVVFNVAAATYRQKAFPLALMGRISATTTVMSWALLPVGSLVGGALGTAYGLRTALWFAAAGLTATVLWLVPLRGVRMQLAEQVPAIVGDTN